MKKETIFRHELNESIQATAAMNCLKNRNNKQVVAAQEQEEETDVYELALEVAQKHARKIARMTEQNACGILMRELCKLTNRDFDSLDEEGDFDYYQDAALYGYDSVVGYDEEEELDIEGSRAAYYSQDEPDYNDDSHGIRLILNMLMKRGDITKNDIPRVQKQIKSMLDEEGMWIGDDDHEAERFIEMLWDNQEQEEDDAEDFISNVVNLMEDEGMIDESQWDEAYYTVEEMIQSNPEMLQYPSYMQFLNVFGDDILSKLDGGF